MTVLHRPGSKHGNADGLSRIPDQPEFCDCYQAGVDLKNLSCTGCKFCYRAHQQWSRFKDDVDDVVPLAVKTVSEETENCWFSGYTEKHFMDYQLSDPCLKKLITRITTDIAPAQKDLSLCGPAVKYFYRQHLTYKNNLLWYSKSDGMGSRQLLVVPDCIKQEVLSLNHNLPLTKHMGITKTLLHIHKSFIWYKMSRDVERFVKSCQVCNKNKKANTKAK